MPLNIPAGFASAALIFTGSSGTQPFVTTIGVGTEDAGSTGDVGVANRVFQAWKEKLAPATTSQLTLQSVQLSLSGADAGSVSSSLSPASGLSNSTFLPLSAAIIGQKRTDTGGRKGRGRMFLPGTVQNGSANQSGILSSSAVDDMQPRLSGFIQALTGLLPLEGTLLADVVTPYVLHTGPEAPSQISQLVVAPMIGWIRGRIH